MTNTLTRLQAWYQTQCDGDWEHGYGIKIGTLDNPGWRLQVNVADTGLENISFDTYEDRYDVRPIGFAHGGTRPAFTRHVAPRDSRMPSSCSYNWAEKSGASRTG